MNNNSDDVHYKSVHYKSAEQVRNEFSKINLRDLWSRILLYADKKSKQRFWRGQLGGYLPNGMQSKDIAQTALLLVLEGERKWPHNDTIEHLLYGVIDSVISHLATCAENKSTRLLTDEMRETIESRTATELSWLVTRFSRSDRVVKSFFEFLKDDPLVYVVAGYILHNSIDKAEDIALRTKTDVAEIYNAKRRLKRKIADFRKRPEAMENMVFQDDFGGEVK